MNDAPRKPRSGSRIFAGVAHLVAVADDCGIVDMVRGRYGQTAARRVESALVYLVDVVAWYESTTGKTIRPDR